MTDRGRDPPALPIPPTVEEPGAFLDRLEGSARVAAGFLSPVDASALDALAVACARGAGAHEIAIGEGLDLLARTGGDVRLGYSGVGDLARERLGLPADQARRLRRNAARLRARPMLREAVLRGEVTSRKAEVVLRDAVGADEAYWVERAKVDTVRRLEASVRGGPEHEERDFHRLRIGLPPEQAKVVEVALEVAGILTGPTAPLWRRLEAMAMEFLCAYPIAPPEPIAQRPLPSPPAAWVAPPLPAPPPDVACGLRRPAAGLPGGPSGGDAADPEACEPAAASPPPDPYEVLDRLGRLVRERASRDEHLGRACLLIRRSLAFRRLGFASFDEYCADRLGLAPSTVRQRIVLERRLQELPALREALRSGRLSHEQARLVARVARTSDVAARIEEAAARTCVAYRRELEAEEHRQMWRAGELRATVPDEVGSLLADAIRSARAAKRGLTPGEALVEVALHFLLTWRAEVERQIRAADRVILRDGALCQVPGCSRPADHVHHVVSRAARGPLEPWNEISLCAIHHLRGVHGGSVRITGTAPGGLAFTLGEREVAAARA
jgi:hypothetical protein